MTGAPWNRRNLYLPESLPKAITEPLKVMAPMAEPRNSSILLPKGMSPPFSARLKAQGSSTTAKAMHTAARPIMLCMKATSSGILVISTRLAMRVPMVPPTSRPTTIQPRPLTASMDICCASVTISPIVVRMAMPMPVMPKTLPRMEVVGWLRPFRAWMKQTEATRYNRTTRFMLIWRLLRQRAPCAPSS